MDRNHQSNGRLRAGAVLAMLGAAAAAGALWQRADPDGPASAPMPPPVPVAPSPVLSPEESLAAIRAPGFRVELVASEPLIEAPVAAVFDEDGRLWVVEMRTYMPDVEARGELEPQNRIVVLDDDDDDGRMDRSTVFLDGLVLPRGVAPCYGGALIIEPPSLFFCRDTDGDGRADEKRELLGGFAGRDNPEHAGNSLLRGLDNWYHLSQHDTEFRFDGTQLATRRTPAHGQWGLTQDDAGRLYYTPNSEPLLADLFPKHYASRGGGGGAGVGQVVARAAAATWPARPTPGVNRGYIAGTLRNDGTLASLTAACGPLVFRAGGLGPECRGDVFICEPAGMLVKRIAMSEEAGEPRGRNASDGSEFLASTDERFRPVNTCTGPDGSLYVVDMSRGVIQHKTYVTPYLREQIAARALERPLTAGRIYRVRHEGSPPPAPPPRLSRASDEDLVSLLSHDDGWWRDSAQRLLVERSAVAAATPLRQLAASAAAPAARMHALWTLEGLGAITPVDAADAMRDGFPLVRAAGVRLAGPFLGDAEVLSAVRACAADPDRTVRVQAACTLGESRDPAPLVNVVRSNAGDRLVRAAAMSGLGGREAEALDLLLADASWPATSGDRAALAELADALLRGRPQARLGMVERAGAMALQRDPRAGALLARVRAAQGLDGSRPRPLALPSEPRVWLAAAADATLPDAARLAPSADWFDWPGRPPAQRAHAPRPLAREEQTLYNRGRVLFLLCVVCHQPDGRGMPALAPPLAGSPIVEGSADRLAKVLLHGLEGPFEIGGQRFEGLMPPPPLTGDEQFAAVMTYIRRSFGNSADPVTPQSVKQTREWHQGRTRPWTREELGP